MNKTELIDAVAKKAGLTKKDTSEVIDATFEVIANYVAEQGKKPADEREKVQIIGFGSFEAKERSARKGRNPQTGEEIEIPAKVLPKFKAGKAFKDTVDGN
ncbi:MAG: HU family DNA-binding protein [bacterium]